MGRPCCCANNPGLHGAIGERDILVLDILVNGVLPKLSNRLFNKVGCRSSRYLATSLRDLSCDNGCQSSLLRQRQFIGRRADAIKRTQRSGLPKHLHAALECRSNCAIALGVALSGSCSTHRGQQRGAKWREKHGRH